MKITNLWLLLLFFSTTCLAQVPGTLSYQGILMQNDGITPLIDNTYTVDFNFYDAPTSGNLILTRTVSVVTAKGLFSCIIGGGIAPNAPLTPGEMNLVGSQQIHVGIKVDIDNDGNLAEESELSPRAQLTSSPYSLRSESVTNSLNPTGGNVSFWGANNTLGSDAELFWDNTNKRLGAGTILPLGKMHIVGTGAVSGDDDLMVESIGTIANPALQLRRSQGTVGTPTTVLSNDLIGRVSFQGYTGSAYSGASEIRSMAETDFGTSINGNLIFRTANNGTQSERMRITASGDVGIGINPPTSKLSVGGDIQVDASDQNTGTVANALAFGVASGERIASKRNSGGNQYGLDLYTGSINRMSITNNGNVGIGTSSPAKTLHVVAPASSSSTDAILIEGNIDSELNLQIRNTVANGAKTFLSSLAFYSALQSDRDLVFNAGGGYAERMRIDGPTGYVGIGTIGADPGYNLEVVGTAGKSSGTAWINTSDRRIKTDIQDIVDGLDIIKRLRPVKFKYTDEWRKKDPSIQGYYYYSFIAQEFQKVFPESVSGSGKYLDGDPNEILSIDISHAQIAAFKAIQEQQVQIEELKAELVKIKKLLKNSNQEITPSIGRTGKE